MRSDEQPKKRKTAVKGKAVGTTTATGQKSRSATSSGSDSAPAIGASSFVSAKPTAAKPSNGKKVRAATAPITGRLWHLSDVHWSVASPPGTIYGDVKLPKDDAFRPDLFKSLLELAVAEGADALVVNGDLVVGRESATDPSGASRRSALEQSVALTRRIAASLGLADQHAERVVVCPGNHDVDRSSTADPSQSLQDFATATAEFITPFSAKPWLQVESIGLAVLALNTVSLGPTQVSVGGVTLPPIDLPSFDLSAIERAIGALATETNSQIPLGYLGVAVGHHPFSISIENVPSTDLAQQPIAGPTAQRRLGDAGFGVFLHGHRHIGVGRLERQYEDRGRRRQSVILGSPRFGEGYGESGFHIIDYVISPRSGEARIIVRPHSIGVAGSIHAHQTYSLSIPPRGRSSARLVKILERIEPSADSRTDVAFFDVPVRVRGSRDLAPGWILQSDGSPVRIFPRLVQTIGAPTGAARVMALDSECTARTLGENEDRGRGLRMWSTEVVVRDKNADSVSFVERTWSNTSYALTREHRARVWGVSSPLPNLTDFEPCEHVRHVLREPADCLEFFVRFPFASSKQPEVRVYTYVEESDPNDAYSLKDTPREDLLRFSRVRIENMHFMKRLRVVIEHPVCGVEYAVVWKLQSEKDSGLSTRSVTQEKANAAERLRASLHGSVNRRPTDALRLVRKRLQADVVALAAKVGGAQIRDLEWALFVTTTSLLSGGGEQDPQHRPDLVPVLASFERDRALMDIAWPAGVGLAGRAYSNGTIETFSRHRRDITDPWHTPNVDTYEIRGDSHCYLAAMPVRRDLEVASFIEMVFCVGTRKRGSEFSLEGAYAVDPKQFRPKFEILSEALGVWAEWATKAVG